MLPGQTIPTSYTPSLPHLQNRVKTNKYKVLTQLKIMPLQRKRHSQARLISPDAGWKWSLQQLAQVSNFQAHNEFHTLFAHCFLSNFFLQYSFFSKYIATNVILGFHILHPLLHASHALSSLTLECQRIHKEIFLQLLLLLTGTE